MLLLTLTAVFAVLLVTQAVPTPSNNKDGGGAIGELPENWDQTKDDTQSLFLNKSDKNDLEPYPLALSEEGNLETGNSEGYEQGVDQRFDSPQSNGELNNFIMRPELYGEPPALESLSSGYESRRRKRGSGKVGGAGAATKVVTNTKSGSGKKNLKPEDHDALSPVDLMSHEHDAHRRKRGSGTKVGGAAASAKSATKNSGGNKKNFRPISERRKRDSGLSAADVRALLNLWEAQERKKQEWNANQWAERYYGHVSSEDDQPEVDENGDIWYKEPVMTAPREQDYPHHVSEESIDVAIPSYPGSPRSLDSLESIPDYHHSTVKNIEQVVDFLEHDDEFLIAAELGDEELLKELIDQGVDVNKKDHLERNALHLAVCTGNRHAVLVLLKAGVTVNVKSNVGMTPLSLCLMRRPSWRMANMLFDYGAKLLPRNTAMDTGLFLQFVMMCIPTKEEERILRLLVEKGGKVDDPQAPGGRQALHFAAMSNNCRLIKILRDMGGNPLLTNHRHQTPRQVAATFHCRDAQKLLAEWEESLESDKQA